MVEEGRRKYRTLHAYHFELVVVVSACNGQICGVVDWSIFVCHSIELFPMTIQMIFGIVYFSFYFQFGSGMNWLIFGHLTVSSAFIKKIFTLL